MKNKLLFLLLCVGSITFGQKKEYDKKLIGCFKGSEQNKQVDGISKYWISCRFEKGLSVLNFITIDEDGDVEQFTENGNWWTNDGKYYEYHKTSNLTDIYTYQTLKNGDIAFKAIKIIGEDNNTYEFVDYKIQED
ncbi:hypothetical protein [Faecalibacter bovis]|uniref:DUF5640 domain-containing protein n=1 Tax=Faecalibacter bovis TaxID=2898187 RepID=A0ABX7XAG4_9FLAO|nr:hypothetical protein [Faecalibacter bovis]QTV04787.1 hypothetical protein J9309_08195 [Faecalibacter bovis]QTV05909.1 hypothetical protein J9309_00735 [Faecalibacter bovis]